MDDANKVRELFDRALALTPSDRASFLDEHCNGDGELRREIDSLLEFHARADVFLEEPVAFLPRPGALPPIAPDLTSGARVDAYVVRERLGEGGMGVVYRAEQLAPVRREVALKVLKASAGGGDHAARFALESQALALMDHANVARIVGAGSTEDGRPFFAMEYVPGKPLARYCDERRLGIEARLRLFLDVCAGVEHAHAMGIVHRDLKPSNVLVRELDGVAVPKIIDFGVAKALVHGLTDQTLRTSPGMVIGTLDYMSPEQALSAGADVDRRTDVYALGVVLYELLVGALPYEFRARRDLTIATVQRAFEFEDPPAPSRRLDELDETAANDVARARNGSPAALRAQLASDLDWIVGKAIDKERSRRYATAAELAADVERFLRHESVVATPPSVIYRARKFTRRNKLWVSIVATLLVGLCGTLYAAIVAVQRAEHVRRQRDQLLPLADFARWQSLRQESERLWPAEPRTVAAMDSWIARATELASRREQHAALLAERPTFMDVRLAVPSEDQSFTQLAGAELDAYFALIHKLVRGLERLESPNAPMYSLNEMRARRELAATLEQRSLVDAADAWRQTIAAVADETANPRYAGLKLAPQLGLVPLGRDPRSGLYEFAHLPSGPAAQRDEIGQLVARNDAGLVLVLVPNATCADQEPFFIAKSELTRAQRRRLLGGDPASVDGDGSTHAEAEDIALALEHGHLASPKAGQKLCAIQCGALADDATADGSPPVRALDP